MAAATSEATRLRWPLKRAVFVRTTAVANVLILLLQFVLCMSIYIFKIN